MSTPELPPVSLGAATQPNLPTRAGSGSFITLLLAPLASLKITVVLFALSIFLVLAGTVAQIDTGKGPLFVEKNYFLAFWTWIDCQIFFPRTFIVPGRFPFPGGWLLGGCLAINLLAAHAMRFKVTGRGSALWSGVGMIVAGIGLTYFVIQSGIDDQVESELSLAFCNRFWHALRAMLGLGTLGLAYLLALTHIRTRGKPSAWLWWLTAITTAILTVVVAWSFVDSESQLGPSSLRILWQLAKSSSAGLVLLAGCFLVFGRRAGIVLLHGGIGLMMFSVLLTGLHKKEGRMNIVEGQTVNYAFDIQSSELAVVDKSDPQVDRSTIVPESVLQNAWKTKGIIDHPALPFAMRVVKYLPNADVRMRQSSEPSWADKGHGALQIAEPRASSTGVDTEQKVNMPAVYVELLTKKDHQPQGTYLLSSSLNEESLQWEDKPYEIALRFKRTMKPYSVKLIDFKHDLYVGTNTPKNYSSLVQLTDVNQNVEREFKIWMNNPLRYGGDTLYQASFDPNNPRATVLQVVTNSGWMIPYVACMLVWIGMAAHFGMALFRFAQRRAAPAQAQPHQTAGQLLANWHTASVWVPALVVLLFAGWLVNRARPKMPPPTEMQISAMGQIPVAYEGRVKPLDTLARNALTILSGREELKNGKKKMPAMQWLLDLVTSSPVARNYKMLRIDNLDVLETLGLKPRKGFLYSIKELQASEAEYHKQIRLASMVPPKKRTLPQKKIMELAGKISLVNRLQIVFSAPKMRMDSLENITEDFQALDREIAQLKTHAPLVVPPLDPQHLWVTLLEAERNNILNRANKKPLNEAATTLREILSAYQTSDISAFNTGVANYQDIIQRRAEAEQEYLDTFTTADSIGQRKAAERLDPDRIRFEASFNQFRPFLLAMVLYLIAFLLAIGSWLGWTTVLSRSAHGLLWLTFALHTYALVARIYISGRPPVTNLYSSAVFIGWGAVLFALVFERIYRIGIGNLLAGAIGFPTLFIAHNLAGDGDTFRVIQAVLDTQFWLTTHVVCITLGYSTTFLAGFMGLLYVFLVHLGGGLDDQQRKQLTRMTYGTLCFAMLFSFVGTVLGGLWADDSWGRFWGWDTKENGALIIVLWNALVLHARWGGMIGGRGLAVLAIFGNVVTSWSWFGVNMLGIGLHSYGFREGEAFWLCGFVLSQLAVIGLGCIPETAWRKPAKV